MKKWHEEASELTAEIKQLAEQRGMSLPELSLGGTVCYGAHIAHLVQVRDSLLNPIEELVHDIYIHSDGGTASFPEGSIPRIEDVIKRCPNVGECAICIGPPGSAGDDCPFPSLYERFLCPKEQFAEFG